MELHDYPRPADDTGIGIHWCAGVSAAAPEMVETFWLRELVELGVKWVKIADQRGALALSRALLAAQIMPIVQIVREGAGGGRLSAGELEEVERLVEAGVRYFELDSEPDGTALWGRERLPADALAVTARAAAANMEAILERGGLPAIPALTPEGDWRLAEEIVRVGGEALFDEPIWLAIHNYSSNRPPHFPGEAAHSGGAQPGREFYAALAAEAWQGGQLSEEDEVGHRPEEKGKQPAGPDGDAPDNWGEHAAAAATEGQAPRQGVYWRAFERLNSEVERLIGRSLPILSTASGYLMNENSDPRYPATTRTLHAAQTLEICRAMMGTSRHTPPAPDYYFCTAFWLLAHGALQGSGSVDEQNAWYSSLHLEGGREEREEERGLVSLPAGPVPVAETFGWSTLPIVALLKAEPKRPRAGREESPPQGPVPSPRYGLQPTGNGVLSGKVRGGAGAHVRLTHSDGFAYESMARTSGVYRFVNLPEGRYSLEVTDPAGSRVEGIDIEPGQEAVCDAAAYGWGFEIDQRTVERGRMLSFGVELLPNDDPGTLAVRISDSAGKGRVVPLARSSQELTASCVVGPLEADSYRLEALGLPNSGPTPLQCQVPIDQGMATRVLFVFSHDEKRAAAQDSAISGTVEGGAGCTVRLRAEKPGEGPGERIAEADETGGYGFSGLAPGRYFVDVKDRRLLNWPRPIDLDGRNRVLCDLSLLPEDALPPRPDPAMLHGQTHPVTPAGPARIAQPTGVSQASRQVALLDAEGRRYVTLVEPSGEFRFDSLPAGDYDLYAEVFGRREIHLAGGDRLSVQLWQTAEGWSHHTRIRTASEAPGMIGVQWVKRAGLTIAVMDADGGVEEQEADDGGEAERPYRAEFGPFPPGEFLIHCPELAISVEVALSEGEAAEVSFVSF